jgi:hypothetical protein
MLPGIFIIAYLSFGLNGTAAALLTVLMIGAGFVIGGLLRAAK